MVLTEREAMLLRAALSPHPEVAVRSWERWAAASSVEDAPGSEVRLLPAVLTNLKQIAPSLELPKKMHGQAKATFAKSHDLVFNSADIISKLTELCPVMPTKGLAILIRFNAWASRPMGDIDIHIPPRALDGALELLAASGWTPKYGMTYHSLLHRTSQHRESWNFVRGSGHLDLHWRLSADRRRKNLEHEMWDTASPVDFKGRRLVLQSPEYAFMTALHHGFLEGNRSDALQTIIDTCWLLPFCDTAGLARLIQKAGSHREYARLKGYLQRIEVPDRSDALPPLEGNPGEHSAIESPPLETALLRRPWLTRVWNAWGRKPKAERLLLKWFGPFSKPLKPAVPRWQYNLRECAVIDEIAGPGWAWPDPAYRGFWAGGSDARLLLPLAHVEDHVCVVTFDDTQRPAEDLDIFANGQPVGRRLRSERVSTVCLMIPGRVLFGPWVELSFRVRSPAARSDDPIVLGTLVRRLRILDLRQMTCVFSGAEVPALFWRLLRNEGPHAGKFARIATKIDNSPHKDSAEIPADFDPIRYVLSYPDLFEHEVDPYAHFLRHGRLEGRIWWL